VPGKKTVNCNLTAAMIVPSNLQLALASTAVLGFRHGLDYDHIAAITDITSVQNRMKDAMHYGLLYVSGHALTVALLGAAAIGFRVSLPAGSDRWAERAVGLTLLVLGIYVLGSLVWRTEHGHTHPKTRITLLINAILWTYWRLARVLGSHDAKRPEVFSQGYGSGSTFLIGVIHGVGAETPTQLLLFLMAANLGGAGKGFLGLGMFIVGLVAMNTLMCASAAGIFIGGMQKPFVFRTVTALTSVYSVVVGVIFLLGSANMLPSLTGS
jgi:high-affinity nickel-transport protein